MRHFLHWLCRSAICAPSGTLLPQTSLGGVQQTVKAVVRQVVNVLTRRSNHVREVRCDWFIQEASMGVALVLHHVAGDLEKPGPFISVVAKEQT